MSGVCFSVRMTQTVSATGTRSTLAWESASINPSVWLLIAALYVLSRLFAHCNSRMYGNVKSWSVVSMWTTSCVLLLLALFEDGVVVQLLLRRHKFLFDDFDSVLMGLKSG